MQRVTRASGACRNKCQGIFLRYRGPTKGLEIFKWDKLQGGDWHIPQAAKTEELYSWKKKTWIPFPGLTCRCRKHHMDRYLEDTAVLFTFQWKPLCRADAWHTWIALQGGLHNPVQQQDWTWCIFLINVGAATWTLKSPYHKSSLSHLLPLNLLEWLTPGTRECAAREKDWKLISCFISCSEWFSSEKKKEKNVPLGASADPA